MSSTVVYLYVGAVAALFNINDGHISSDLASSGCGHAGKISTPHDMAGME